MALSGKSKIKRRTTAAGKAFKQFTKKAAKMKGGVVVGFPASGKGAKYPDGTPIFLVAAWQEFGTVTIPERPFMRRTLRNNGRKYKAALRLILVQGIKTGKNPDRGLKQLGALAEGDVKAGIVKLRDPANAPSTIKRKKGAANPLIDNSVMLQHVTHEARKRG